VLSTAAFNFSLYERLKDGWIPHEDAIFVCLLEQRVWKGKSVFMVHHSTQMHRDARHERQGGWHLPVIHPTCLTITNLRL
jgi:hypothetical protein